MRLALALAALLALSGCDLFSEADPAWTQAGAVAVFDYEPGPDSLRIFVASPDGGGEHRAAAAQAPALAMRVVASERWRSTDRHVRWEAVPPPGAPWASYDAAVQLPLDGDDVTVVDDGLGVVVSVDCTGGLLGGARGSLTYVRVPNRAGTVGEYSDCQRSLSPAPFTYPASGPETVTVPAGTVSTLRVDRPTPSGTTVEWWSWEAGLVRLDVLNPEGELRGRFVRSAAR